MSNRTDSKLIAQLRTLLQLTQTEAQIAQTRRAQARTEAVERELAQNARNAEERTRLIGDALRSLGGVPDVVTPAVGRVTAVVKATAEQAQPLEEALLGDLALEHQLLDRVRYVKALAETADRPQVKRLADRLETAHTATVDWLTVVLAEEALGGPAALRPTPIQFVVGLYVRAASLPARWVTDRLNKVIDRGQEVAGQVRQVAEHSGDLKDAVAEVFVAGRDAALDRAELVARREGAEQTADTIHETRRELGAVPASELPIKNYDNLGTTEAVARIKELDRAEDVQLVVAYEETHKNRSSVVSAAQTQLAKIAKTVVGVSS
jgi:hypothetical protein